jgi:hypothetical protein
MGLVWMICEIRNLYMTPSTECLALSHMKVTRTAFLGLLKMLPHTAELENLGY